MKAWSERPVEVAYLLNPAFCGEVLLHCIKVYSKISRKSFPYTLSFLVLPLVLHKKTRDKIPGTTKNNLHVWLNHNREILIGFAHRAANLVPITREAMIFLNQLNVVKVDSDGGLKRTTKRRKKSSRFHPNDEMKQCFKKAETLGKWFARGGTPTTIMFMFGVKP